MIPTVFGKAGKFPRTNRIFSVHSDTIKLPPGYQYLNPNVILAHYAAFNKTAQPSNEAIQNSPARFVWNGSYIYVPEDNIGYGNPQENGFDEFCGYSEDLESWSTKTNITVVNDYDSSLGINLAKLTANSKALTRLRNQRTGILSTSTQYILRATAKYLNNQWIAFGDTGQPDSTIVFFDVLNGLVGTEIETDFAEIYPVGTGFELIVAYTTDISEASYPTIWIAEDDSDLGEPYTGQGVLIGAVNIAERAYKHTYIRNNSGDTLAVSSDYLRWDL